MRTKSVAAAASAAAFFVPVIARFPESMAFRSIVETAQALRRREVSAVELAQQALARVAASELNAFIDVQPELTLAQKWDLTATELARNVHTHPTLSEALQECFHGLAGHMINF